MTRPAKRSSRPRQLPAGMQRRGNMYYCRFRAGGRLIRQPPENIARNPLEPLNEVLPIFRRCGFKELNRHIVIGTSGSERITSRRHSEVDFNWHACHL